MKAFVMAPGPSMSQGVADIIRPSDGLKVAVSDAYRLAPWADCLVSTDAQWWFERSDARRFAGRRFAAVDASHLGCERVPGVPSGMNSGLVALRLAVMLGATLVVLTGIDLAGSHFFGPHAAPLANTSGAQFEEMQEQFEAFRPAGVEIVNVSPTSKLRAYAKAPLKDFL